MNFLDAFVAFLPTLGFFVLAAIILVSAWMVSQARRITHAAFFMVLAFTGVAGVFLYLGADFLAGSQVLIYVGAIAIMFLFAIMVSDVKEISDLPEGRDTGSKPPEPARAESRGPWIALAALVAAGFAGLVLAALARAGLPAEAIAAAAGEPTTAPIGRALFTKFLVPFEVASVVLLAALVGAIVLAGRDSESAGPGGAAGAPGPGAAPGRAEASGQVAAPERGPGRGRKGEAA